MGGVNLKNRPCMFYFSEDIIGRATTYYWTIDAVGTFTLGNIAIGHAPKSTPLCVAGWAPSVGRLPISTNNCTNAFWRNKEDIKSSRAWSSPWPAYCCGGILGALSVSRAITGSGDRFLDWSSTSVAALSCPRPLGLPRTLIKTLAIDLRSRSSALEPHILAICVKSKHNND